MLHHIEYGKSYTTLLTAEENNNPFLVMEEVFENAASPEKILDELFDIITVAIRKDYWLKYESPLVLYHSYKKIMRVLEAGWLISKIRPDDITREHMAKAYGNVIYRHGSKPEEEATHRPDHIQNAYLLMTQAYQRGGLFCYRIDLLEFLFEGLHPTCVTYYSYIGECILETSQEIEELLKALHLVYHHQASFKPSEKDNKILEALHNSNLQRKTLYKYSHGVAQMYDYTSKKDLQKAFKAITAFTFEEDFWKWHHNPANMLYHFHDFLFLIESFWQYHQYIDNTAEDNYQKWKITKVEKSKIYQITKKQFKNPGKYLNKQFSQKSLAQWRQLLENFLEDILSNKEIDYEQKLVHKKVTDFLSILLIFIPILKRSN